MDKLNEFKQMNEINELKKDPSQAADMLKKEFGGDGSKNMGGSAGGTETSKADSGSMGDDKLVDQAKDMYQKYSKDM